VENKKKYLKKLKKLFWSVDLEKLDPTKDKVYIINQALAFGSLDEIKLLLSLYSIEEVRQIFLKRPKPLYSPQGLNFIQKYILQIKDTELTPNRYLKNIYGPVTRP
jgi:hypothetical protein